MPFNLPWYDASHYSTLKQAVDTIGTQAATLVIASRLPLGAEAVAVPQSLALKFLNGGELVLGAGEALTLSGPIEAGLYRIFDYEADTAVLIFTRAARQTVYPEWWGAVGDGNEANEAANNRAFNRMFSPTGSRLAAGEDGATSPSDRREFFAAERSFGDAKILAGAKLVLRHGPDQGVYYVAAYDQASQVVTVDRDFPVGDQTDVAYAVYEENTFTEPLEVKLPGGRRYCVSETINVLTDTRIIARGASITSGVEGQETPAIRLGRRTPEKKLWYTQIDGLWLTKSHNREGIGLLIEQADFTRLDNCLVSRFYKGIAGGYVTQECTFNNVQVSGCNYGYYFDRVDRTGPPNVSMWSGGKIQQCPWWGIWINGMAHAKFEGLDLSLCGGGEAYGYLNAIPGDRLRAGETFTVNQTVFEFDDGGEVAAVSVAIDISDSPDISTMRERIIAAINGADIGVIASTGEQGQINLFANDDPVDLAHTVADPAFTVASSFYGGSMYLESCAATRVQIYTEAVGRMWTRNGAIRIAPKGTPSRRKNRIRNLHLVNCSSTTVQNCLLLGAAPGGGADFDDPQYGIYLENCRGINLVNNASTRHQIASVYCDDRCRQITEDNNLEALKNDEEPGSIRIEDHSGQLVSLSNGAYRYPGTVAARTQRLQNFVASPWDFSSAAAATTPADGSWYAGPGKYPAISGTISGPDGITPVQILNFDTVKPVKGFSHMTRPIPGLEGATLVLEWWTKLISLDDLGPNSAGFPRLVARLARPRNGGATNKQAKYRVGPNWIRHQLEWQVPIEANEDERIEITLTNREGEAFHAALGGVCLRVKEQGQLYYSQVSGGPLDREVTGRLVEGPIALAYGDSVLRLLPAPQAPRQPGDLLPPGATGWQPGDLLLNPNPDRGVAGWLCQSGGDPGRWSPLLSPLVHEAVLDFPAPAAVPGHVSQEIEVAGATVGDRVEVAGPAPVGDDFILSAHVSGVNRVKIKWTQLTGAAADPDGPGGVYRLNVWQGFYSLTLPPHLAINGTTAPAHLRLTGREAAAQQWLARAGFGQDFQVAGAGPLLTPGQATGLVAPVAQAVQFNGGQYYLGPNDELGNLGSDDFVVELIYRHQAGPAQQNLLYKLDDAGWRLYVDPSGTLNFLMQDPSLFYRQTEGLTAGKYYHVLFFADRDEPSDNGFKVFVDGEERGGTDISSASGPLDAALPLSIGGGPTQKNRFNDQIALVQIWRAPNWHPGGPANQAAWQAIARARAAELGK